MLISPIPNGSLIFEKPQTDAVPNKEVVWVCVRMVADPHLAVILSRNATDTGSIGWSVPNDLVIFSHLFVISSNVRNEKVDF